MWGDSLLSGLCFPVLTSCTVLPLLFFLFVTSPNGLLKTDTSAPVSNQNWIWWSLIDTVIKGSWMPKKVNLRSFILIHYPSPLWSRGLLLSWVCSGSGIHPFRVPFPYNKYIDPFSVGTSPSSPFLFGGGVSSLWTNSRELGVSWLEISHHNIGLQLSWQSRQLVCFSVCQLLKTFEPLQ